ncbi:hypothetical protein [Microvirga arsenatis]|uniref:DUF4435 domain-containing protein n=1 Tax=Microvirga arsenatis TaxID=2692265 RepID=A0ABW9Z1H5_9HYPH|nr:hypothetical protein [Microvirga arsenatis]NBJ12574.1 hypothetical protein [Microvirga arsenatis]NBJ26188.1 hypothetical protein [Microvirga arsenatis]
MPVFTRTLSGFRNYKLFTKKDVTAFCEGGSSSIAPADALAGRSNAGAEDITFWDIITSVCVPGQTFHLKAVGDCNAVHAIADWLIANNVKAACAFIDRDWRDFDGTMRVDNRAIYTPDYAWENTVVRPEVIAETILSLGHLPRSHKRPAVAFSTNYLRDLQHALRWPIYMDISGIGSGASFVDKTERCGGAIDLSSGGDLRVDRAQLRARFKRQRHQYQRNIKVTIGQTSSPRLIPGHVLMGAAICIVQSYLKKAGVKGHSGPSIRAALLQQFRQSFGTGPWRHERTYFRRALGRIPT